MVKVRSYHCQQKSTRQQGHTPPFITPKRSTAWISHTRRDRYLPGPSCTLPGKSPDCPSFSTEEPMQDSSSSLVFHFSEPSCLPSLIWPQTRLNTRPAKMRWGIFRVGEASPRICVGKGRNLPKPTYHLQGHVPCKDA